MRIRGDRDSNNLDGGSTDDIISGLGGDDMLRGFAGNDKLVGGAGDDILQGGIGDDRLDGGDGIDTASFDDLAVAVRVSLITGRATSGGDVDRLTDIENLTGTAFGDVLTGNDAANVLIGGNGNDLISGGAGADTLAGGDGYDTLSYADALSGVIVFLSDGMTAGAASGDGITGFEALTGSSFNDTLRGDAGSNLLLGGDGNDILYGSGGSDVFNGGRGDYDAVVYGFSAVAVTVDLSNHAPQFTGAGSDTFISIEVLGGSAHDDHLTGDRGDNVLIGLIGNDTLDGNGGFDVASYEFAPTGIGVTVDLGAGTATGGAGNDTLIDIDGVIGSIYADTLIGDGNSNYIAGLAGADILTGGGGLDLFDYDSVAYSNTADGIDLITDFAAGDVLDLSAIDADSVSAGDQAFAIVNRFHGVAGELVVKFDAATALTTVSGDIDGDRIADLVITFAGNVTHTTDPWLL